MFFFTFSLDPGCFVVVGRLREQHVYRIKRNVKEHLLFLLGVTSITKRQATSTSTLAAVVCNKDLIISHISKKNIGNMVQVKNV